MPSTTALVCKKALLAVNRLLHLRIEILNAEARPRHADLGKCIKAGFVHVVGFDFDADLRIGKKIEAIPQDSSQGYHIFGLQHGRRAAAEMHGADMGLAADKTGDSRDLRVKRAEIRSHRLVAAGLLCMARTEPAQPVAIRHVQVERDLVTAFERLQPASIDISVDARMEMRRGRVTGITRDVLAKPGS